MDSGVQRPQSLRVLLLGAFLVTACVPATRSADFKCKSNDDCSAGRTCDDGWCVASGDVDSGDVDSGDVDSGDVDSGDVGGDSSLECVLPTDCTQPPACRITTGVDCVTGVCQYPLATQGAACDNGDPCVMATCNASGECIGGPACWSPPTDYCLSPSILRQYGAIGTCTITGCSYTYSDSPCPGCPTCGAACAMDIDNDGQIDVVADNATNPTNGCEHCNAAMSASSWTSEICAQQTPVNPCIATSGICDPQAGGGSCVGQACCDFAPIWDGDGTAPDCPLGNEDANGDGLQGGETWTGSCTTSGSCSGCTAPSQCSDSNPCSVDDCVAGDCEHDFAAGVGATCSINASSDGLCVAVPPTSSVCKLADGEMCTDVAACASGICACADASCSAHVCSQVSCDCQYNANGNGTCDAPLSAGTQDSPFCDFLSGCYSGDCLLLPGSECTANAQCGVGTCECANAPCSSRQCSPVACDCRYNTNGDSTCDDILADGVRDPGFCEGDFTCEAGVCTSTTTGQNGEVCNTGADCNSGICDCANAACSDRVCVQAACDCEYDSNGDGTCEGELDDYVHDPPFCDLNAACVGGACVPQLAIGTICTIDGECDSRICECTSSSCYQRRCAPTACDCGYDTGQNGSCDGSVVAGTVDPPFCNPASSCNGTGGCVSGLLANAAPCSTDPECQSGFCECADAQCTAKICSGSDCGSCDYTPDGIGSCSGNDIADGYDDAVNTCGSLTCNGNSSCNIANGGGCSSNYRCESNLCGCGDAACSSRICTPTQCDCGYDAAGDGTCDGPLTDGFQDEYDCDQSGMACFGGSCGWPTELTPGAGCAADANCAGSLCECANSGCTIKLCTTVDCPCQYDSTADGSCDGNIGRYLIDPDDSCGYRTCNGQGACHLGTGDDCTEDWQCESDSCSGSSNTCRSD